MNAFDKVLHAVEPDGNEGWIEYALSNYRQIGEQHDERISDLAAEELQDLRVKADRIDELEKHNEQLRAQVESLAKKLIDERNMFQEERE